MCATKIAAFAALLILGTRALPEQDMNRTDGWVNGGWWVLTPNDFRLGYMAGYTDALWLNKFYAAPENRPIPVPEAVSVMRERMAGASDEKISARISGMRQVYGSK